MASGIQRAGSQLANIVSAMTVVDDRLQEFSNIWNPSPKARRAISRAQQLLDDAADEVAKVFRHMENDE